MAEVGNALGMIKKKQRAQYVESEQISGKGKRWVERKLSWALLVILQVLPFPLSEIGICQVIPNKGDSGFNRIPLAADLWLLTWSGLWGSREKARKLWGFVGGWEHSGGKTRRDAPRKRRGNCQRNVLKQARGPWLSCPREGAGSTAGSLGVIKESRGYGHR